MSKQFYMILIFGSIILVTIILAIVLNRMFKTFFDKSSENLLKDPTNYRFIRHLLIGLVYLIGFGIAIYSIPSLRALAGSLLAGAGILAVVIGFASQAALSNIISGVFIVIFKPFRINDNVSLNSLNGVIEDITLRHTVIRNFENKRIIIPNSVISNEVIVNSDFKDERICKWIEIEISYDSDVDLAKLIIHELIINHPLNIDNRNNEQIRLGFELAPVKVISLSESSIKLRGWAWAKNSSDGFNLACDVLESIAKKFKENGISIPILHRSIVIEKDNDL